MIREIKRSSGTSDENIVLKNIVEIIGIDWSKIEGKVEET